MGGVASRLGGAKFGHGFASAGVSAFAKPGIRKYIGIEKSGLPSRVIVRAVLGGTLSKATGGKFANGASTAAFSQLFNDEQTLARERAYNEQLAAQKEPFADYFNEVTGMSVEDSISLYKAQTGESLSIDQVEKLFTDPAYAKEQLMASENLHKVYRGILNSNVPQTSAGAQEAGFTKLGFFKSLFHNPISNSKWVGPSGHLEGVYSRRSGTIDVSNSYGGTFNFFGPDNASAHKAADVDPYLKWGN